MMAVVRLVVLLVVAGVEEEPVERRLERLEAREEVEVISSAVA
jgi:hypothetical protein